LASLQNAPLDPPAAKGQIEPAAIAKATRRKSNLHATYEIKRPTRVYSGPSEETQLIANVEPGMMINVVDAQNGWLEIQSKYGRPPGFIKRDAAAPAGQN
jgi:hypothetical protein